jgi:phosphoglucosamine mutase
VLQHGADIGFAHDGDADRVIAVDETGRIVDGDAIMGVCAMHMAAGGRLAGNLIVATVMSNLGLEVALRRAGIVIERTKVGDRYVLERMRELGASLGGEQSGHIIFLDHATTGDGLVTAVQVTNVMMETGRRLSELAGPIQRYPQVLKNVRVASRGGVGAHPAVQAAVGEAERRLGARGRVLVRPSGTEPLVRVMVEAEDEAEAESLATHLAEIIWRASRQG